jgi:hypothetical protein
MRVQDDAHEFLLHAHLSSEFVHVVQWLSTAGLAHVAACSSSCKLAEHRVT